MLGRPALIHSAHDAAGAVAVQTLCCVLTVQATFALGMPCPDGGREAAWPPPELCGEGRSVGRVYNTTRGEFGMVLPKAWCARCDSDAGAAQAIVELAYVVVPHALCLLGVYLTLRSNATTFVQLDTRQREAAMLRQVLALLQGRV